MTGSIASRLAATPHPRLTVVLLAGVASLAVGGALVAAGRPAGAGTPAFRALVVGYLLVLFGAAGYLALAVGRRVRTFEQRGS